jgi:hypothetical protein
MRLGATTAVKKSAAGKMSASSSASGPRQSIHDLSPPTPMWFLMVPFSSTR